MYVALYVMNKKVLINPSLHWLSLDRMHPIVSLMHEKPMVAFLLHEKSWE